MNNAEGKKNRLIREISLEKYGRMGLMLDRIVELEKENEELREAVCGKFHECEWETVDGN